MADKRPPITPEQGTEIAEYREAGCSVRWIAAKLVLSPGAVGWYCLRNGIDSPNTTEVREDRRPMVMRRGGHVIRRFTPEEDAILLALAAKGARLFHIAKQLGRGHNSVLGRLATLARRDERRQAAR